MAWRACEDSQQPQAAAHVLAKCQRSNRSRPKQTTESKGSECIDARPGKIGDVVGLPLAASTMGGADGKTLFCLLPRRRSLAHLSLFLPRHRSVDMPAPVSNLMARLDANVSRSPLLRRDEPTTRGRSPLLRRDEVGLWRGLQLPAHAESRQHSRRDDLAWTWTTAFSS